MVNAAELISWESRLRVHITQLVFEARAAIKPALSENKPATEWIFVVSIASPKLIGGRMVGSLRVHKPIPAAGSEMDILLSRFKICFRSSIAFG